MPRPRFSQRIGKAPIKTTLQTEDMDTPLRNGLWDIVTRTIERLDLPKDQYTARNPMFNYLMQVLWHTFFNEPIDTIPFFRNDAEKALRDRYYKLKWHEVYDFLESFAASSSTHLQDDVKASCNSVLERELSGYRFVGPEIAPITNPAELAAIEEALTASNRLSAVNQHLQTALARLSDRTKPDYRNSIKESVSAVEAICQRITAMPKATLGDAVRELKNTIRIHPAFEAALHKLYGYTSDADGIRHALLEDEKLTVIDAKFMLVLSAGFVAYLIGKLSEVRREI